MADDAGGSSEPRDAASLPGREELAEANAKLSSLADAVGEVILGQQDLIEMVLAALVARGHVLFEGLPGLGKTQLVRALAGLTGLEFRRVQFTPDLMPGDITGTHLLVEREGRREFEFRAGPIFGNLVLADEINRASPKTQSALLEAMQERSVTVLGETRPLPDPFFVFATQNPIELEGTYPLPEAQLDRFLFKLQVTDVDSDVLAEILRVRKRGDLPALSPVVSADELREIFALADAVYLPDAVRFYIARLVRATSPTRLTPRPWGGSSKSQGDGGAIEEVRKFVKYGSSPRGAIAIANAARALAVVRGKPNVGFDEVKAVAPHALSHRVILDYPARLEGFTERDAVRAAVEATDEVGRALPAGVERG